MSFIALRLDLEAAEAEPLADALLSLGALSVDASDCDAGSDQEIERYEQGDFSVGSLWARTSLLALFPECTDVAATLRKATAEVGIESSPPYQIDHVPDEDWVTRTQAQFEPIQIAQKLWVVPTWRTPVDPLAVNIILDPGLAFGTGSHPTTRLCLRWLAAELRAGETVLDYGCGSGILAIAAALLGARGVTGVDIDAQALAAGRRNAVQNQVSIEFSPASPCGVAPFDVLLANILARPLQLLAPHLASRVRCGGRIVLSGILTSQTDEVAESYGPWFSMEPWANDEGWVALTGIRK